MGVGPRRATPAQMAAATTSSASGRGGGPLQRLAALTAQQLVQTGDRIQPGRAAVDRLGGGPSTGVDLHGSSPTSRRSRRAKVRRALARCARTVPSAQSSTTAVWAIDRSSR